MQTVKLQVRNDPDKILAHCHNPDWFTMRFLKLNKTIDGVGIELLNRCKNNSNTCTIFIFKTFFLFEQTSIYRCRYFLNMKSHT